MKEDKTRTIVTYEGLDEAHTIPKLKFRARIMDKTFLISLTKHPYSKFLFVFKFSLTDSMLAIGSNWFKVGDKQTWLFKFYFGKLLEKYENKIRISLEIGRRRIIDYKKILPPYHSRIMIDRIKKEVTVYKYRNEKLYKCDILFEELSNTIKELLRIKNKLEEQNYNTRWTIKQDK